MGSKATKKWIMPMNGIRRGVSAPRPEIVPAPIIRGGHDKPRAVAMLLAVMVKYKIKPERALALVSALMKDAANEREIKLTKLVWCLK